LNAGQKDIENILTCQDQFETVPKNQHRHSAAVQRISYFSFQIKKIKREDSSDLRPQDDEKGKLVKILEQSQKSPLQYFCDIINSNKSEFSQTGMTYTRHEMRDVL
jgi:hypothetical protein